MPENENTETMKSEKTQTESANTLPPAEWLKHAQVHTICFVHNEAQTISTTPPAEWLQNVSAKTIYYVHNEVQGNSNKGNINVGTDPYIAEQIARMAQEIALLREQVQTLCGIMHHASNTYITNNGVIFGAGGNGCNFDFNSNKDAKK